MTDHLTTACKALDSVLGAKRDTNGRLIFDAAHERVISEALSAMKAMKQAEEESIAYAWEVTQGVHPFLVSADVFTKSSYDVASYKPLFERPALSSKVNEQPEKSSVQKIIHRGFAHSRTTRADQHEDTVREKSLADKWEMENPLPGTFGIQPTLNALIPDCSARDAQVAATVVQWIGSQVGFCFLEEALEPAGFKIIRQSKAPA